MSGGGARSPAAARPSGPSCSALDLLPPGRTGFHGANVVTAAVSPRPAAEGPPNRSSGPGVAPAPALSYPQSAHATWEAATDALDLALREGGRHRDHHRRAAGGHLRQPGR